MSRPTAAYVDGVLACPIRLALRQRSDSMTQFVSIRDALELVSDLTAAIKRSLEQEAARELRDRLP